MKTLIERLCSQADALLGHAAYEAAVGSVAQVRGVLPAEIKAGKGRHRDPRARDHQVAIYLTRTVFELPLRRIAEVARLDESGVRKACAAVERRREDPVFDRELDEMELGVLS